MCFVQVFVSGGSDGDEGVGARLPEVALVPARHEFYSSPAILFSSVTLIDAKTGLEESSLAFRVIIVLNQMRY